MGGTCGATHTEGCIRPCGSARRYRGAAMGTHISRQCSRTACAERAEATLSYDYRRSLVWLEILSVERDPHAYDLCARHADRVRVPAGWSLDDRRRSGPWPDRLAS